MLETLMIVVEMRTGDIGMITLGEMVTMVSPSMDLWSSSTLKSYTSYHHIWRGRSRTVGPWP